LFLFCSEGQERVKRGASLEVFFDPTSEQTSPQLPQALPAPADLTNVIQCPF